MACTKYRESEIICYRIAGSEQSNGGQLGFWSTFIQFVLDNDVLCLGALHTSEDGKKIMCQEYFWSDDLRRSIANGTLFARINNAFICAASFARSGSRRESDIKNIYALFADLDYRKMDKFKDLDAKTVADMLLDFCLRYEIPLPSMIVASGHGLHVWWMLKEPVEAARKHVWRAVEQRLVRALSEFGADRAATDPVRFLRIPGCLNTKDPEKYERTWVVWKNSTRLYPAFESMYRWACRYEENEYLARIRAKRLGANSKVPLYQVKAMIENQIIQLPEREKFIALPKNAPVLPAQRAQDVALGQERRRAKANLDEKYRNFHAQVARRTNTNRAADLERLVALRNNNMTSCRNNLLLIYRTVLRDTGLSEEECCERAIALNKAFTEPLDEKEIAVVLRRSAHYTFSNQRIIDILSMTEQEQVQMVTIYGSEERSRRRRNANKSGMNREEKHEYLCGRILMYLQEGFAVKDIAELIGVCVSTVRNHIRRYDLKGEGARRFEEFAAREREKAAQKAKENGESVDASAMQCALMAGAEKLGRQVSRDYSTKRRKMTGCRPRPQARPISRTRLCRIVDSVIACAERLGFSEIKTAIQQFIKDHGSKRNTRTLGDYIVASPEFLRCFTENIPGLKNTWKPKTGQNGESLWYLFGELYKEPSAVA